MLFYENFERICRLRETSPSGAVVAIGKNKTTAGNWKRNNTIPSEDILIALANHLNCYVSDFFRMPGEPMSDFAEMMEGEPLTAPMPSIRESMESGLDESEADFLAIYDECTKRQKSELMALVYGFAEECNIDLEEDEL